MRVDIAKYLEETALLINKTIEKYIPRQFSRNSLIFKINQPKYDVSLDALNKAIADPIWEFLDRGGKRWRPSLFLIICESLGKNASEFVDFAIIPEVVHNGTLMIDDLEDSSEKRRGKLCTYLTYGIDVAVNAGNALYYLPLLPLLIEKARLSAEKLSMIYEIYVEEMISLSIGQAMDIAWHKGLADANETSEEEYLQMCAYKTGTLARMAARIAAVLGDASPSLVERLGRFAESLGIAFQMQDDILDLTGEEFVKKKGGAGRDITEGKRSLLVVHTLRKASPADRRRLIEILDIHTDDQRLRNEAISLMTKYGSIKYVKQCALQIVDENWHLIDRMLPTSDGKEKLYAFAKFLIDRNI